MNVAKMVDAKGLSCPMPLVKTKKAIDELTSGQVLEVQTTDKGAKNEKYVCHFPHWRQIPLNHLINNMLFVCYFTICTKKTSAKIDRCNNNIAE